MQTVLKIEYIALFLLSILLFSTTEAPWWWYPALFLVPDIGMVGYLKGTKTGSWTYNTTHFLGLPVTLMTMGVVLAQPMYFAFGAIVLGHIAFDRALGYGLKYCDSFKHTHLGNL